MKVFAAILLAIGIAVVGCNRDEASSDAQTHLTNTADVTAMDPNTILFTTPTLNDAIPTTTQGSRVPADCIQLHEDDWRQFELIPYSLKPDVDAELADINTIWDGHSVPIGDSGIAFNEVHVRRRIPNALDISMSLAEFEMLIGDKTKPMTFFGYNEILRDVHAVTIDKLTVYAHIHKGTVTALAASGIVCPRLSEFGWPVVG